MPLPKFDPLLQFRAPYNYELAGKNYNIIMDDGNEYAVSFLDGHSLNWSENGGAETLRKYDCLKAEDDLYFVHIIVSEEEGKEVHYSLILDLRQDLVTLVTCTPYGINTHRLLVRGHRIENEKIRLDVRITSDAVRIEAVYVAPFIAGPVLLIMML